MSVILPTVSLAAAVVGTTGTVNWGAVAIQAGLDRYQDYGNGNVQIYNESGCGLQIQLGTSGEQTFLPAGGWRTLTLGLNDTQLSYTVLYVIANAPVTSLIAIYYAPGEQVDEPGILGNSPIGLSGSVPVSVTQVIQDGQASGLTIVESTPTGGTQTILMDTSPKLKMNAGNGLADKILFEFVSALLQDWQIIYRTSGNLVFFENSSGVTSLGLGGGAGIKNLGGQGTVGNLGVPAIVAQAIDVLVAATTLQTLITYTVGTTGLYRISLYISLNNGTNGNKVTANVISTDPDTNLAAGQTPSTTQPSVPPAPVALNGTNTFQNGNIACFPLVVYAKATTTIQCQYQDPTNTPNDHVTYIIERLS